MREKATGYEFANTSDDRILEHLIQTIENQILVQKCISKGWTLTKCLAEAGQIEDVSVQVQDWKADPWSNEIARVEQRRNRTLSNSDNYGRDHRTHLCSYCGLIRAHSKNKNCPAYGVKCETCKKFNHFTSVCRGNMWKSDMITAPPKQIMYDPIKRKESWRHI